MQKYCDIRKFMAKQLDEREAGRYATLVRNVEEQVRPSTIKRERANDDQAARKFHATVMAGKVRVTVRQATKRK